MSTPGIEKRVQQGRELTRKQKLRVLTEARDLLDSRWCREAWVTMVDEVEHFCLYGGLAKVLGLDPEQDSDNDPLISQCSLTSTMFDALPAKNKYRVAAENSIRNDIDRFNSRFGDIEAPPWREEELIRDIMTAKVTALQGVNDRQGRAAVLRVLDKSILALKEA